MLLDAIIFIIFLIYFDFILKQNKTLVVYISISFAILNYIVNGSKVYISKLDAWCSNIYLNSNTFNVSNYQCFKNRTGPAGRTGLTGNRSITGLVSVLDCPCNWTGGYSIKPVRIHAVRFKEK
jgi:hypothetical protein